MPKISKTGAFKDQLLDNQINEIIANQFLNTREVQVVFAAADKEVKVDAGFLADRFLIVDRSADISVYRTKSDNKFIYFKASGAGTVNLMIWKGGN
jgi:hypothetical protein